MIYAHDQFSLTGQVSDEEGKPLVYVNGVLLSSGDSTMVKGATIQIQNIFSEHLLF